MPKDPYVFISYSTKDNEFVEETVELIKSMNVPYWKAPEMIPSGSSYAQEIVSAIRNCSLFLVLLSENSQSSMWVEKEIDCALSYERDILPFNIDDTPLKDTFRFYLNNVQMIFHAKDHAAAINDLKKRLSPFSVGKKTEEPKKTIIKDDNTTALNESEAPVPKFPRNMKMVGFDTLNRFPSSCQYCGQSTMYMVDQGLYYCRSCGQKDYDDFTSIKNYLNAKGPQPVAVIERELGIPRKIINDFWRRHGK